MTGIHRTISALVLAGTLFSCAENEVMSEEQANAQVEQVIPAVMDYKYGAGCLPLTEIHNIVYSPSLEFEAEWLHDFLHDRYDFHCGMLTTDKWQGEKAHSIMLNTDGAVDGEYMISSGKNSLTVTGGSDEDVFRGVNSLVQLFPEDAVELEQLSLPSGIITDRPRFGHRGLLLDCCRHFMTVDFVKEMIDHLSFYKMNVLHWHLTEDQGWRIQIDAYPELTEHGAWRTEADGSRYGGFYTKDEIREVVAYAAQRHITVIPEIEMPGHSSAAISAYPWLSCTGESIPVENEWGVFKDVYCAGNDSTLTFMKTVLDEVVELFPAEFIHIGGDEAPIVRNEECSKCQRRIQTMGLEDEHALHGWFIAEMAKHLEGHGKTIIGWDEILEGGLSEGAVVQSWRGMEGGKEAIEQGHRAIMSPTSHCYLDYPLSSTDTEEVFGFNPIPEGLSGEKAAMILGGEVNMWTERAPQSTVESKVFPRLLAMSEVLWRQDSTRRDYPQFQQALRVHYPLMEFLGLDYGFERVPLTLNVVNEEGDLFLEMSRQYFEDIKVTQVPTGNDVDPDQRVDITDSQAPNFFSFNVTWRGRKYPSMVMIRATEHLGLNGHIKHEFPYSSYYTGGGDDALCDGILGTGEFRDGHWQALQGETMSAVLDLGEVRDIKSVSTGFLQYNNAWIFLPREVEYAFSNDGEQWRSGGNVGHFVPWSSKTVETQRLDWSGQERTRFIRMRARGIGPCPEGHDAEGSMSWIFCDEIVVR